MTNPTVLAQLRWAEDRVKPVQRGDVYSTASKVFGEFESDQLWSMTVTFIEASSGQDPMQVQACFCVEDAPHHLLQSGRRFELFEGRRLSAYVDIL